MPQVIAASVAPAAAVSNRPREGNSKLKRLARGVLTMLGVKQQG